MKKIIFIFLSFFIALSSVNAQKGINYSVNYAAGGKLIMCVDSLAKNVYYGNIFPNQPYTSFNYVPEVNNLSIEIYFRNTDNIKQYRYTILVDDKPIVLNKPINLTQMTDVEMPDETFSSSRLGNFPIKGKIITILVYSLEKPLDIEKSVFYGKSIPKGIIKGIEKRFIIKKGVDYSWITTKPKERINLNFSNQDDELTIVKDKSDIDYIYSISIKDKQTDKIIFDSNIWQYGGLIEDHKYLPYVRIDKNIFKKSGDYEVIIKPQISNIPQKDIESYITKYTLLVTLENKNYTKKELVIYGLVIFISVGLIFLTILYLLKHRNMKDMEEKEKQKDNLKLQLNSIRSQLNPHFLFNALAGIQNLMNKNEIDNANKYLSKFARLTRNVLDDKELVSLSQEKNLLDDYLQMEQLRFGFKYEINYSENLDINNIEIPSMLLQPFVENAVKHGISQKALDGKIIITFISHANDLVLNVIDNGNGFDTKNNYSNGLGLQLSASRIELLNNIYKQNSFTLDIQSNSKGTKISLILTDWL